MVDTRVWLTPDVVDIVDTREGAPGTFVFCRMIGGRGGGRYLEIHNDILHSGFCYVYIE